MRRKSTILQKCLVVGVITAQIATQIPTFSFNVQAATSSSEENITVIKPLTQLGNSNVFYSLETNSDSVGNNTGYTLKITGSGVVNTEPVWFDDVVIQSSSSGSGTDRTYTIKDEKSYTTNITRVIIAGDIKPKTMKGWFKDCSMLKSFEIKGNLDTSECEDFTNMFRNVGSTINIGDIVVRGDKDFSPKITDMFYNSAVGYNLYLIGDVDVSGFWRLPDYVYYTQIIDSDKQYVYYKSEVNYSRNIFTSLPLEQLTGYENITKDSNGNEGAPKPHDGYRTVIVKRDYVKSSLSDITRCINNDLIYSKGENSVYCIPYENNYYSTSAKLLGVSSSSNCVDLNMNLANYNDTSKEGILAHPFYSWETKPYSVDIVNSSVNILDNQEGWWRFTQEGLNENPCTFNLLLHNCTDASVPNATVEGNIATIPYTYIRGKGKVYLGDIKKYGRNGYYKAEGVVDLNGLDDNPICYGDFDANRELIGDLDFFVRWIDDEIKPIELTINNKSISLDSNNLVFYDKADISVKDNSYLNVKLNKATDEGSNQIFDLNQYNSDDIKYDLSGESYSTSINELGSYTLFLEDEDYGSYGFVFMDFTIVESTKLSSDNIVLDSYNSITDACTFTLKNGNDTLVEGTDYSISYTVDRDKQQVTATATGIEKYSGTVSRTFDIDCSVPTNVSFKNTEFIYNGVGLQPKLNITSEKGTLTEGTDYI